MLISNKVFTGGKNCLTLEGEDDVVIRDCAFTDPEGPADPYGHCLQLISCRRVHISRCVFTKGKRSEDAINIFKSQGVTIADCRVLGTGESESGNGITIDYGSSGVTITRCKINTGNKCGIVVAYGSQHLIVGNDIDAAWMDILVRGFYTKVGKPTENPKVVCPVTDVVIHHNRHRIEIAPPPFTQRVEVSYEESASLPISGESQKLPKRKG